MFESCTTEELTDSITQLFAAMTAAQRHLLAAVAEFDRREAWRPDGARSMADWLALRTSVSSGTAREWARVAEALESLPEIDAAFGRGELSFDQVAPLTVLADPEDEVRWLENLQRWSVTALRTAAQHRRRVGREDALAAHRGRECSWRRDLRNPDMGKLYAFMPWDQLATVTAAVTRLAEQASPDPETGEYESYGARCADALVALAGATLAADADADRATVVVHVDAATLAGDEDGLAELEDGTRLSVETVRRLACGARWQLLAEGPDGCVKVGRMSRTPPAWMARRIRRRDKGCRFAGCSARLGVQIHHIEWWEWGGHTDEDNLVSLCPRHHHLVHEGGWSIRGDPRAAVEFVKPDGSVLATGPPGLRDDINKRLFGGPAAA